MGQDRKTGIEVEVLLEVDGKKEDVVGRKKMKEEAGEGWKTGYITEPSGDSTMS